MGCVTLLSDFGLRDASVAAAKGVLMQHLPGVQLIDISHDVEPFHLQQAAYLLMAAARNFAPGTCHILLLDIFSEKAPRLLLCEHEGQYYLAPDNGILPLAFGIEPADTWTCYELKADFTFREWLEQVGSMAAKLQTTTPAQLKLPHCKLKQASHHWLPKVSENMVECHVMHVDRYENVVLNITKEQFDACAKGRPFRIVFARDEELSQLSTHYYNVGKGVKLCRFNATGYLEIAINHDKASSLFGLKLYHERNMMYHRVKIRFGEEQ